MVQIIPTVQPPRTVLVDSSVSGTTYVGIGMMGSVESDAVWQIFKVSTASGITKVQFADGDENYNNVWDDRDSLTYSD